MAPVLQCPDCGEKHPLSRVPSSGAFECQGCGRILQVPEAVGQRAAARTPDDRPAAAPAPAAVVPPAPAPTPRPVPVASATSNPAFGGDGEPRPVRPGSGVDEQALGALSPKPGRGAMVRLASVPWWMRLLLWIVALPLSFLLVFLVARVFGLFTTNQLSDVFLANNSGRFWPVARLLPFVALLTAALVQGGVYLLARWRGGRLAARSVGELSAPASRSRARAR
jgi:hypothetical protein